MGTTKHTNTHRIQKDATDETICRVTVETQVWRIDACRNIHTITSVDFPVRRVSVDNRRDIRARGTEGAARQPKASGNTPRQKRA